MGLLKALIQLVTIAADEEIMIITGGAMEVEIAEAGTIDVITIAEVVEEDVEDRGLPAIALTPTRPRHN